MRLIQKLQSKIQDDRKNGLHKEAFWGNLFEKKESNEDLKKQFIDLIPNGNIEEVKQIIESGLNAQYPELLTEAIIYSREDVVEVLLNNGADALLNSTIEYGMTPLTLLINNVDNNYIQIFGLLVNAGADTELADESGNTPLHCAVMKNKIDLVAAIVTVSPNAKELLETKNKQQLTALDIAKKDNNEDMIQYLSGLLSTEPKKTSEEKAEVIDFFDARVKRLKKKLTPSQYEELKEEYEDLREENLNAEDEEWKPKNFKERFWKLLEDLGFGKIYFEDVEEDEDNIK